MALLFSTIDVTRQVFFRSSLSYAIVNLKPIVPGHVLVIPNRTVARLPDLTDEELSDLLISVKKVGTVIEREHKGDGLTIACQDGKAAGQSVPHVHFHVMPRKLQGDYFAERNDDLYPALERAEGALPQDFEKAHQPIRVDADEDRKSRTMQEMQEEAHWLSKFFEPI